MHLGKDFCSNSRVTLECPIYYRVCYTIMKSLMLSTIYHLYGCVVYLNIIHSPNVYCARVLHITFMDVWFILILYIHQMSTVPE